MLDKKTKKRSKVIDLIFSVDHFEKTYSDKITAIWILGQNCILRVKNCVFVEDMPKMFCVPTVGLLYNKYQQKNQQFCCSLVGYIHFTAMVDVPYS